MKKLSVKKHEDLLAVTDKLIRSGAAQTCSEAIILAAKGAAPRFYVDGTTAQRVLSAIDRGQRPNFKNHAKGSMYDELYRRFCQYRKSLLAKGQPARIGDCIFSLVEEPAPSFFMSLSALRHVFWLGKNIQR